MPRFESASRVPSGSPKERRGRMKVRRGDEKVAESGAGTNDSGNGEKDADGTKGGLAGSDKIARAGTTQRSACCAISVPSTTQRKATPHCKFSLGNIYKGI